MHHCLGGCERTHRTLGERLAVFCKGSLHKWHDYLSSLVFSMNCAFKGNLGYSSYEIIYGMRPCFPLKPYVCELDNVSIDMHHYMREHSKRLEAIRESVKQQSVKHQQKMIE